MNKRDFLRLSAAGIVSSLAGCQRSDGSSTTTTKKTVTKRLSLTPTVSNTMNKWQLEVVARNVHDWHTSIYDIHILAYDSNGAKVCEAQVGDLLSSGDFKRTIETTCSTFPAIITATARETPCEGTLIPVLRWIGTDEQRKQTAFPEEQVWESTYRKCGEDLPPQRVLDKFETSAKANE